mgnify:CR=1 FL=1|tara:strand:+ start:1009 stop:1272 length:264 start_codon:yes stop_codon:yes gene_type:complete
MPRYQYHCNVCADTLEVTHSIKERLENCESCSTSGSLKRIPGSFITFSKHEKEDAKVGDIVESTIEEARRELEDQKKELNRKQERKL